MSNKYIMTIEDIVPSMYTLSKHSVSLINDFSYYFDEHISLEDKLMYCGYPLCIEYNTIINGREIHRTVVFTHLSHDGDTIDISQFSIKNQINFLKDFFESSRKNGNIFKIYCNDFLLLDLSIVK